MNRCITLGLTLCLLGFVSGCCCGGVQGCGFRRFGGCSPCGGGCGASYAPMAPIGGCNSCGTGGFGGGFNAGFGGGGAPPYGQPGAFYQPYGFGTASATDGAPVETAAMPYNGAIPSTMAPMNMAPINAPQMATALAKPDSLATY